MEFSAAPVDLSTPTPSSFHITNDLSWPPVWPPPWNLTYPDFRHIYCTPEYSVRGERKYLAGALFIAEYLFYLSIYVPIMIVIARKPLIQHACYKFMLAVAVFDNIVGFFCTFLAGIYCIVGEW